MTILESRSKLRTALAYLAPAVVVAECGPESLSAPCSQLQGRESLSAQSVLENIAKNLVVIHIIIKLHAPS